MKKTQFKKTIVNIRKIMRILCQYNQKFIYCIMILSILSSLFPIASMLLTQEIMNTLQLKNKHMNYLLYIVLFYLLIKLLNYIITNIYNYIVNRYNDYLMVKLNILFQEKCSMLSFSDFENSGIYDMLQRAEQQIGIRPISLIKNLSSLTSAIVSFICSMIILSQWQIWTLLGFVLMPIFSYKYYANINKLEYDTIYKRAPKERLSWYYSHLLIKDYYVKEVRLLGITEYFIDKFKKIKKTIYNENIMLNNNRLKFNMFYQFLNLLLSSIIVVYAILQAYLGKIFVGNLLTYINTTSKIESSVTNITSSLFAIYTDSLYCDYILTFFDYIDKLNYQNNEDGIIIDKINYIEFKSVSYKYPNSPRYVLKNISFKLDSNNTIALVGENGSGKTTLIKILCGLYNNYEGEIYVNDFDLKTIDKKCYQRLMSVVFQDYNNYEFTVNENIGLGDIENLNNEERIIFASRVSGANKFIESLPNRYEQQIGTWFENGMQLSGGQWQKMALARGIYRNASFYIFDEPTASLDPSSEYIFFKNFKSQICGKITLFVTHRFTNAKLADTIFVLKDGEIIEKGSHLNLLDLDKEYARLYKIQLGELEYKGGVSLWNQ